MARGALRTLDTMRPGAPGEPGSPGNNVASVTQPATHSLWLRAAIVIVAGLLAYSNSFSGPFIFDDEITIVENSQIRDLTHLTVLSAEREVPTAGRPLVNLSFALNYAVGGLNVTGYHAVNLALHLLCALLLFGLVHRIVTMSHAGGGRF